MIGLLLALIYLAFISLGLPDSLLGSAWPIMHLELKAPLSSMGVITMIISSCTIISSLFSDKLVAKLKTGLVVTISVLLTCFGLFGFSVSSQFYMVCLFAIPYGLGAGAIDSVLNNYVALHYSSRQMVWLHCFWGIGAVISPYIMSFALTQFSSWNTGYRIVGFLQLGIAIVLFSSLPLWKKVSIKNGKSDETISLSFREKLKIKNIYFVLFGFMAYCAIESTMMIWSTTYMVKVREITPEKAASLAALFYIGMTSGRLVCGFISNRLGDKRLIRIGQSIILVGLIVIAIPQRYDIINLGGFLLVGLGCAPIYPSIIHSTPNNFERKYSQAIIGLQMASAYIGSTVMPPIFGLFAQYIDCSLLPYYGLFFWIISLIMLEKLNFRTKKKISFGEV